MNKQVCPCQYRAKIIDNNDIATGYYVQYHGVDFIFNGIFNEIDITTLNKVDEIRYSMFIETKCPVCNSNLISVDEVIKCTSSKCWWEYKKSI